MACHSLSFHVLFHTPFVLLFPPSYTHFNTSRVLFQFLVFLSFLSSSFLCRAYALFFLLFPHAISATRQTAPAHACAPFLPSHLACMAVFLPLAHVRVPLSYLDPPSSHLALVSCSSHFAPRSRLCSAHYFYVCSLPRVPSLFVGLLMRYRY